MLCQRVVRLPRTFVKPGRLLSSGVPLNQQHDLNAPEEEEELRLPPSMMNNLMDVGARRIFDKDQDMFRESVRRFVRDELVPEQAKCEERGHPSREMWEKMGEAGLLGILVPAEVGGIGGTIKEEAIVTEEMAYANVTAPAYGLHSTIVMPYFANLGTKEQQEKYIPAMTAGKCVSAIAMTEPDAGSDLQGVRTNAVKDGDDHYIINGSKTYITNGWLADVVVVVAATNKEARSKAHGITLFLVEDGTPGFKKGNPLKKVGLKTQDTAELFFEDVRVHKSAILGGLNQGFYKLMTELPQERLSIAVAAAASSEWMFEETRAWVRNRRAFGKSLSNLLTIQHKMAELKTSIAVTRSFVDDCIELHSHKALDNQMASMAKYWATDLQNKVAQECLQLHGGWGFMWETPIAKAFADARVTTIFGGTNEIMKNLIARSIINDK